MKGNFGLAGGNLNILHLVLSFRRGGRRNAIANLAGQTSKAVNCHLACLDELGCPPEELGGLFRSVSVLERPTRGHCRGALRLSRICRERKIDLIHAHDAASQYAATVARFFRPRMKLVMTFHRTLGFESARHRDKLRNAFCGFFSQAIVTASTERKHHFLSENAVPQRKLTVIPFGVDLERFRPDPSARREVRAALGVRDQTLLIGAIGHFGPEKGIDQAVRAFQTLSARNPETDAALVVLGDGTPEQREAVAKLVRQNPSARVILAGFQEDVWRWLPALDVFLHTPRMEAFGLALIEAMACGLPVVATRVGSLPEIVREAQTGLVVEAGSVEAIAAGLSRVVRDEELRHQLASHARQVAQREYSSDLCARRYVTLYERVCGRADPACPSDIPSRSGATCPRPDDRLLARS